MKKIFTLLLAAGSITFVSAQSNNQRNGSFNDKDVKQIQPPRQSDFEKNQPASFQTYSFSMKDKDAQIKRINREFDQKIWAVKMNRRLRNQEKFRQIRMLENQRNQEIREVQLRWERSNRGNKRDYRGNNSHY